MQRHDDTQHADTLLLMAPVRSSPPTSRELLDAMEQMVSHLAVFCREVEAVLRQYRQAQVEKGAS
jgi:hypothetical protein